MCYWNPNKEDVIFFHLCGGYGGKRNSYLKVDTINQKVVAVHLEKPGEKDGRTYCKGIYEIKWITWLSGYIHYLQHDYRKLTGVYSKDHPKSNWQYDPQHRVLLKRTSKNQFEKAVTTYLKTIL